MGSGRAGALSLDVNTTPRKRIVQRNEVLSYMRTSIHIARVKAHGILKGPEGFAHGERVREVVEGAKS